MNGCYIEKSSLRRKKERKKELNNAFLWDMFLNNGMAMHIFERLNSFGMFLSNIIIIEVFLAIVITRV
jgi:hypothetical protein